MGGFMLLLLGLFYTTFASVYRPYQKSVNYLNWLQIFSFVGLTILAAVSTVGNFFFFKRFPTQEQSASFVVQ